MKVVSETGSRLPGASYTDRTIGVSEPFDLHTSPPEHTRGRGPVHLPIEQASLGPSEEGPG